MRCDTKALLRRAMLLQKRNAEIDAEVDVDIQDKDKLRAWHVSERKKLYLRCIAAGNYADAKAVLKDLAELQGLYEGETGKAQQPLVELRWIKEVIVPNADGSR